MQRFLIAPVAVVVTVATALLGGCGKPNVASVAVRRENQDLRNKVAELERREQAHLAQIRALESNATTVPSLPSERLNTLFTTHGLRFGRLTGSADLDPKSPGEDGLKVYVVPTDGHGQPLKAAGSFVVEAFDLAQGDNACIGRWEYPLDQAAKNWFGQAMLYTYVLPAPWQQQRPGHEDVTVRVTFTDALTGRTFTDQKVVKVKV